MTHRDFFSAISTNETLSEELRSYATEALSKLDARNAKRRETPSKAQKENEPLKQFILDGFVSGKTMVAADVAAAANISTQKASALLRQLVADGSLSVEDVKIPKKGVVKAYKKA